MKRSILCLFLFVLIFGTYPVKAQFDPDKVCRIEEGNIVFQLNPTWSDKEKREISVLFDLDSLLLVRAFRGEPTINFEGESWKITRLKSNLLELSKPFSSKPEEKVVKPGDLLFLIDRWMKFPGVEKEESVIYGVNNFEITHAFQYKKSAWFYLAGNKQARNVYISGSFNSWSTTQNPMKAVETGWTADLNLQPGKYTYKFIIDGKWISDPYNNLREKDGSGGYNSVVYCPNHLFQLKGNPESHKVSVAGNFNNWKPGELKMNRTEDGWALPIFLRNGTWHYKFITDDRWYTDPANPTERRDVHGNVNSVLSIGEPYLFKLEGFPGARVVILTGSFNGWNTTELLMDKTVNGWQLPHILPAGNYEYKFIVDGKWMTDPANPFTTGADVHENSFISLKANHLFELDNHPDAKEVIVTGNFNNWNKKEYRMKKKEGKWMFPMFLKQGKCTYKFIVDGNWITDPNNSLYERNEVGTNNSVLWITP
jgi:hypothetical protein